MTKNIFLAFVATLIFAASCFAQQTVSANQTAKDTLAKLPASDAIIYVDAQKLTNEALTGLFGDSPETNARIKRLLVSLQEEFGYNFNDIEIIAIGYANGGNSDDGTPKEAVETFILRGKSAMNPTINQFFNNELKKRELRFMSLQPNARLLKMRTDLMENDVSAREDIRADLDSLEQTTAKIRANSKNDEKLNAELDKFDAETKRVRENLNELTISSFGLEGEIQDSNDELNAISFTDAQRNQLINAQTQKMAQLENEVAVSQSVSSSFATQNVLKESLKTLNGIAADFDKKSTPIAQKKLLKGAMVLVFNETNQIAAFNKEIADAKAKTAQSLESKPTTIPTDLMARTEENYKGKQIISFTPKRIEEFETLKTTALVLLDEKTLAIGETSNIKRTIDAIAKPQISNERISLATKNPKAFAGFQTDFKIKSGAAFDINAIDYADSANAGSSWQMFGSLTIIKDDVESAFTLEQTSASVVNVANTATKPITANTTTTKKAKRPSALDELFDGLANSFIGLEGDFKIRIKRAQIVQKLAQIKIAK